MTADEASDRFEAELLSASGCLLLSFQEQDGSRRLGSEGTGSLLGVEQPFHEVLKGMCHCGQAACVQAHVSQPCSSCLATTDEGVCWLGGHLLLGGLRH